MLRSPIDQFKSMQPSNIITVVGKRSSAVVTKNEHCPTYSSVYVWTSCFNIIVKHELVFSRWIRSICHFSRYHLQTTEFASTKDETNHWLSDSSLAGALFDIFRLSKSFIASSRPVVRGIHRNRIIIPIIRLRNVYIVIITRCRARTMTHISLEFLHVTLSSLVLNNNARIKVIWTFKAVNLFQIFNHLRNRNYLRNCWTE